MTYPKMTLPQRLDQTAQRFPRSAAMIYFSNRIRYDQLLDQVNRCAAGLQALGVKKGDRVALMLPNCPQFVIAFFGALRAGAIVTATSHIYTAREAGHQWHDSGAETVIVEEGLLNLVEKVRADLPGLKNVIVTGLRDYYPKNFSKLCRSIKTRAEVRKDKTGPTAAPQAPGPRPLPWRELLRTSRTLRPVSIKPADVACLQYTGGTTGTSKGAMLTHANLAINAQQSRHLLYGTDEGADLMVAALPLFHIYAMSCIMISSVLAGGAFIILPRFELQSALNVIRKYRPTIFHGVPTMYVAFNNAPNVKRYGFHSLRLCTSGGAPLPVEVRETFEALTGGRLVEGYGLTEASPVTHFNPPNGLPKVGSIGLPVPDTEVRIVDVETGKREMPLGEVGEIVIRGPQVMKGYWKKAAETALVLRNGWLYTGDMARKDEDGYYYIVDRKKDLIIAGGFNIYPREVEEVLFEHPQIKEAVVVGVPDPYRGETVKAFVVLQEGGAASAEEIMAFCRERLAPYKVPRQVVFRDSLPKSGVGKYLRRELKNM